MISLVLAAVAAAPASKGHAAPTTVVPISNAANAAPVPLVAPESWFQLHAAWLTHGLAGLSVLVALSLIILLAIQTTKQEGLSGTIGGRVESTYSRMGAEDQLKRITGVVAVTFVLLFTVLSLTGI